MEGKTCGTCAYYKRHYIFDQQKIFRIYTGHCTYARVKTKKPHTKACDHYMLSAPDEASFVSKEYLSKVLLKHVMELELLPEIHDAGG